MRDSLRKSLLSEKSPNHAADTENGLLTSKPCMDTKSCNLAA